MSEIRLIDANALKNKIRLVQEVIENDENILKEVFSLIDNAPTVEPKLKDDIIEAFNLITDQEFEHSDSFWIITPKGKKIEFEKKRPQGKWIYNQYDGNPNIGNWHCSNCNNICAEMRLAKDNFNFCPNCGAAMREYRGDKE